MYICIENVQKDPQLRLSLSGRVVTDLSVFHVSKSPAVKVHVLCNHGRGKDLTVCRQRFTFWFFTSTARLQLCSWKAEATEVTGKLGSRGAGPAWEPVAQACPSVISPYCPARLTQGPRSP